MAGLAAGVILAGRWRLVARLGSGATAEVWQAEPVAGGDPIVLKVARDEAAAAVLAASHRITARLVHPGILASSECLAGPPAVLVLPLRAGPGIGQLRGADYHDVLRAVAGLADTLAYAHRQGIVHGDVKASNVLGDATGQLFLADFGAGAGSLPAMSPARLDGAAATASDDVYALGALLVDLLAGVPPFHPDVTPERIRTAVPAVPETDLAGTPLPAALRALIGAMLAKSAAARPPGMAAVRAALDEVLAVDAGTAQAAVIRARVRSAATAPPAALAGRRAGVSASFVYAALAIAALAVVAVVIYLPQFAPAPQSPLVVERPAAPESVPAAPAPTASQADIDLALGEFLRLDDELKKLNPARWAAPAWDEIRRRAVEADAAIRSRDGAAALSGYRAATALARELLARADGERDRALREGEAAIAAGDQALAADAYERALAISPGLAAASEGLARAGRLDRVLALAQQAEAAAAAGARADALGLWREVLALDPRWQPARSAVAALETAAAADDYQRRMAAGFASQAAGDSAAARAAFEAALAIRPGDAAARAALAQAESDRGLGNIERLAAAARKHESAERWDEALAAWDAALAVDAGVIESRQARDNAARRLELDRELSRLISASDQFNDDRLVASARATLVRARATTPQGPRLAQQTGDLDRLIVLGTTPVPVRLESDGLTEVTVFRIGRLGPFATHDLDLRPGTYTAVGTRAGFRDVRVQFRVSPGSKAPVVVRCEEAI
ncbi:MAG: hypothetical protein FJ197_07845 [Gammaproteobacteria bacterium]|nr:hypothetical protein [Gammaproteobacteria bacterium]